MNFLRQIAEMFECSHGYAPIIEKQIRGNKNFRGWKPTLPTIAEEKHVDSDSSWYSKPKHKL